MARTIVSRALPATLSAILVGACGAPPPPARPVEPPIATASATATPAPPPPTATASAPPALEPPSPFFALVVNALPLDVFPLKTGAIVMEHDAPPGVASHTPALVDERGAHLEPRLFAGLGASVTAEMNAFNRRYFPGTPLAEEGPFAVSSIEGDWPRSGALTLSWLFNRTYFDVEYTWIGAAWKKAAKQSHRASGGAECGNTIPMLWRGRAVTYEECYGEFRGAGPQPVVARGAGDCPTKLAHWRLWLPLRSSDLASIGWLCDAKGVTHGGLAVERWPPGSSTSIVEPLPGSDEAHPAKHPADTFQVLRRSATDLYVYADEYVAHFDGTAWADVSPPFGEPVRELWIAKDGLLWARLDKGFARKRLLQWLRVDAPPGVTHVDSAIEAPDESLWASIDGGLWHRARSGAWEHPSLPRAPDGSARVPESVHWMASGTMLVRARGEDVWGRDWALLGTVKPDAVLDLAKVDAEEAQRKPATTAGRLTAPTPDCTSLVVVLYRLSRAAPKDFDFPLTREALKGHTELAGVRLAETEDAGDRYLVAYVPTAAMAAALVKIVQGGVASAQPQVLCGTPPKENRKLTIDLRTGELVK